SDLRDADAWTAALEAAGPYDVYHLPAYHALAEQCGEGLARLFVYEDAGLTIALPLLLRPLDQVPGLEQIGAGGFDAVSAYGYPGPVVPARPIAAEAAARFQTELRGCLGDLRVVAAFSRLHPLLAQGEVIANLGEYVPCGQTVSLDLRLDQAAQLAGYRQSHRYEVRRLRQGGLVCERDAAGAALESFIEIYAATMRRVGASEGYFFTRPYFESLLAMDGHYQLFVCRQGEQVIAAALFSRCQGIVQYHLAGTHEQYLKLAPMKLIVDEARHWANEIGAEVLHLGGGIGSREDTLFQFKAGFSHRRHRFAVWRWVISPEGYARLNEARALWAARQGLTFVASEYFPAYRRPMQAT
ncbi:MAG: GNAT family N-acetyltransferase, partial [Chloroflexales bacterium]|nr:GNAT family N-acetyltransferase [Chloroflexales bacterium]